VPEELHAYIDSKVAVSTRSTQVDAAKGFITYMLRPDHNALWKAKGLERLP
jgi:ABC-type molybdate transport system substrate-binding protein